MTKLNTYLNSAGNAEEAFSFYKSVFGGEFASILGAILLTGYLGGALATHVRVGDPKRSV